MLMSRLDDDLAAWADDLAGWADAVRLSDAEADGILQRIVGVPPEPAQLAVQLDPRWWREFTVDFTARIVACTRPQRWAA
jgi:hypothetical protein